MTATATQKPTALDAYIAAHATAADLIADITEALDEHHGVSPEAINWGHTGDVNAVIAQLKQVRDFISGNES